MFTVYQHKNKINGKSYISKLSSHFYDAIKKYNTRICRNYHLKYYNDTINA